MELLIAIGLIAMIAALGLFISFDFYKNYSFRSERSTIVSILQKARSQSMDNINEARHGVYFSSPLKYIVFECKASKPQCLVYADADTSKDLVIDPSYSSVITGTPISIVFDQLSGCLSSVANNCSAATSTVTATDSIKSYNITINNEGRIDWQ